MSKEQSTAIKGIAILMMLFYHLFNRTEVGDLCTPLLMVGDKPLVFYISQACYPVTFFLILSGYGLTYLYQHHRLTIKSEVKRLSKVYFYYWIVLFIFVSLAWFIRPGFYKYDILHVIGNLIAIRCNYNGEIWFLFPYAMICLSSFLIIKFVYNLRDKKRIFFTIVAYEMIFLISKYLANHLSDHLIINILELQIVYYVILVFYFSLGIILYKLLNNGLPFKHHSQTFYLSLLIALFIVKSLFKITIIDGLYAFLFIVAFIQLKLPVWIDRLLQQLGRHSMIMWMTHTFYSVYLFEQFIYGFNYPLLIFTVLVVVSYLTSLLIKSVPKMWIYSSKCCIILIVFLSLPSYIKAQTTWPDIPLIDITTTDHEMPSCSIISAPEGYSGTSITDNKYVPGRMVMTMKDDTLYDSQDYVKGESGMRIKIRGNSTGAYLAQHPYKIKLSKKYDLLGRQNTIFKHKEWVLLSMYTWNPKLSNQQSNVLNIAGLLVSKIMNKEWTPEYDFVNLVINGQYQGMYYLIESVEKGEGRVNISNTGFLIEHDTFWWNEDIYFKTNRQYSITGYTYKYPDSDDVNDSIQNAMLTYMNTFEDALYSEQSISEYIDYESFAKWIMIHDILGTDDEAGCNRYLYKYNLESDNPYSSPLKMGPVWDFDSMFKSNGWSVMHNSVWFYYPLLFSKSDFLAIYLQLWHAVKDSIKDDIHEGLKQAKDQYAGVFDKNMKLHQTIYPDEGKQSFVSQIDEVEDLLNRRVDIVDALMKEYEQQTSIFQIYSASDNKQIFNLSGQQVTKPGQDVYIINKRKYLIR